MKQYSSIALLTFLFCIMLFFPAPVFQGASNGLLLWFNTILPTLLPFMIISNLLVQTDTISFIAKIIGPLIGKILHVSNTGAFAVLTGFLCGYPMGAKVTADLIKADRITLSEGKYLLSFCNNTSPMFIISYVVWQHLNDKALTVPAISILMLSPLLCSFIFRIFYTKSKVTFHSIDKQHTRTQTFDFSLLDSCIMNSVELIVKVGGYIMLFSILLTLAKLIPYDSFILKSILLPMLEVTNGVPLIAENVTDPALRFAFILGLTSFGGFCAAAQTKCMIQETNLPIMPYILEKLITMIVTSLFAYLYMLL